MALAIFSSFVRRMLVKLVSEGKEKMPPPTCWVTNMVFTCVNSPILNGNQHGESSLEQFSYISWMQCWDSHVISIFPNVHCSHLLLKLTSHKKTDNAHGKCHQHDDGQLPRGKTKGWDEGSHGVLLTTQKYTDCEKLPVLLHTQRSRSIRLIYSKVAQKQVNGVLKKPYFIII